MTSKADNIRRAAATLRKELGVTNAAICKALAPPRGGKGKGGGYEREVCKLLSMWWSGGAEDDLFWRAQASGARATQRTKRGKTTAGHYGDVAAVDERGAALTKTVTIEIKRGYNEHTIGDVLDTDGGCMVLHDFFTQAIHAADFAGTYWALIAKRDRRVAIIYMEWAMVTALRGAGALRAGMPAHCVRVRTDAHVPRHVDALAMPLDIFLREVQPKWLKTLNK